MKVALCMSGLARTFKRCYQSYLDNVLNKYDCDIFLYISKDANSSDLDVLKCAKKVVLDVNPVLNEKDFAKYKRKCKKYSVQGILQQLWKIYECHQMMLQYQKDNNIKYDLVIRCRPDLKFLTPLDDLTQLNPECLYVPSFDKCVAAYEQVYGKEKLYSFDFIFDYRMCIPDQMAISGVETMGIYANRFVELDDIIYNRAHELHAEGSLLNQVKFHKLKVKFLKGLFKIER